MDPWRQGWARDIAAAGRRGHAERATLTAHGVSNGTNPRECRPPSSLHRVLHRLLVRLPTLLVAALAALATAAPIGAQARGAHRDLGRDHARDHARDRARATLDSIARAAMDGGRAAGLVALVVRGRDTLVAGAYGRADVENEAPLGVDHVFQLASITKQFTAAAVLTLVDAGRVALDTPITRYLPDAPVGGRPITVRQLLAHTSGLPDYAESPDVASLRPLDPPPDSLLALVRTTPFYFASGDQMRYSNTGFVLLGQLITRVSGQPYASYVEERVLRPAGVARAHFCDLRRLVPRLARGYSATAHGIVPAAFISPHVPYAAGGFCGTAGDLTTWNAALHGGRVLSPAALAEMTRPGVLRGGRRTRYGLGLGLSDVAGRRAFHHGGDIHGFTTFTAYLPDDSLSVAVLINTQGPTRPDLVAAALVDALLGARPARIPSPPPSLRPFVGRYGGDVEITIATDGAGAPALRMARGPLPPVLLRAAGHDGGTWTFTDGRSRYTFEPGASSSPAMWADLGVAVVHWARAH